MNTNVIPSSRTIAAATALLVASGLYAVPQYGTSDSGNTQYNTQYTQNDQGRGTPVRIMRASTFLGTDVISSDGRKVGDITDFIFDTSRRQRLAYVIVSTGGFLGLGGDNRAVPAEAITFNGDTARIQLSKNQFMRAPKLNENPATFLSNRQNVAQLQQTFGVQDTTGTSNSGNLLSYSALSQRTADSQSNGRLGYIDDVWISLNNDRAPYVEITPTMNPFHLLGDRRYAIPMSKLTNAPQTWGSLTFAVSPNELMDAPIVSDAEGVRVVNDGYVGNQVLRVTLPSVAEPSSSSAAGNPTGVSSSEQNAGASSNAISAAQQIRSAFDTDDQLRNANIRVSPQNNRIILSGTVSSENLRDLAERSAQHAAQSIEIDNTIEVQSQ